MPIQVVFDTNVLVAALRSRLGASFVLLSRDGDEDAGFELSRSVPLVLEYEMVLRREMPILGLTIEDIEGILNYLCSVANLRQVFSRWRPLLRDPNDDMVLELAAEAGVDALVTFNVGDFAGAERLGVRVMTPAEFLRGLRAEE